MNVKVAAYADDITLFLTSDGDFEVVGHMQEAFAEATGACVNQRKSTVMCVGS